MLKTTQVFLILLLTHCLNCNKIDVELEDWISFLTKRMDSCSSYFQYQRVDDFINGKLTLPNIKLGDNVKLTIHRLENDFHPRFDGILLPEGNPQDIIHRVQNGESISYRVDFPVTFIVPQLIKIFINDNELCATKHNYSNNIYTLQHTLEIVNDSLPVFTYNINIPHFPEDSTCELIDTESTTSEEDLELSRGEHPWLTAIYKKETTGLRFLCAGSLVTSEIILAAAHCFREPNLSADQIVVKFGQNNLTSSIEDSIGTREITALIFHPKYKPESGFSDADLTLLKMKDRVSFTKFIKPICLWSRPADESLIVNHTALLVGWGSNAESNTTSMVPRKLKMNIISETECRHSSLAYRAITSSRTLCAENIDGFDSCERFYGGGLVIYQHGHWILRGVLAAGITFQESCDFPKYVVYSDLAKYISWLETYTKQQEQIIAGSVKDLCGRSDASTESRSEHPWLVAVYGKEPTGVMFYCTGALISSQSVLAPAHCLVLVGEYLRPPEQIRVYLGRYDLNNIQEKGVQTRDVSTLNFHPDFKPTKYAFQNNNTVLLQMKSPVSFTQYIKPICLWSEPADQSKIVGKSATLSSWNTHDVYDDSSTVPQSIQVKISTLENCQSLYFQVNLSSLILCAPRFGNKMEGILMLKVNGRWLLRGMTSLANLYSSYKSEDYWSYTDLADYFSWIQTNMLL